MEYLGVITLDSDLGTVEKGFAKFQTRLPTQLFYRGENFLVGLKELHLPLAEVVKGTTKRTIFIKSDVVQYNLHGNRFEQLLRVISLTEKASERATFQFIRPNYFPLYSNFVDRITIQITDGADLPINLEKGRIIALLEVIKIENERFL